MGKINKEVRESIAMSENRRPPWAVSLACAISLSVCIWDIALVVLDKELIESAGFLIALLALNMIPLVFTLAAFVRRNWGRIVLVVLTALGALTLPFVMLSADHAYGTVDAETVLYTFAEVTIIVLLFVPASNRWYRKPRVQSPLSAAQLGR